MTDEKTYDYVLGLYEEGKLDTVGAIRRFRAAIAAGPEDVWSATRTQLRPRALGRAADGRRWALAAAYGAASVLVAFAAVRYVAPRLGWFQPKPEEAVATPEPAAAVGISAAEFVFNDAPLGTVLSVLSSHYGCVLTAPDTTGRLNGTFRKSDDVETVVGAIEEALGVDIEIVR